MIRADKMTIKTQEALGAAQQLAATNQNGSIEPEHLLLALLDQEGGLVGSILQKIGVNPPYLHGKVTAELKRLPQTSGSGVQVYLSSALHHALDTALHEAEAMGDEFVSTEHLLLGLVEEKASKAASLLADAGATRDTILAALKELRGDERVTDQNPEEKVSGPCQVQP
jgi:ATP-dependent Clp protease ATP-binding subunit ClpB